jgi:predicted small metal-binding protein
MRDFHCSDAGMKCDFVARGSSNEEILEQARRHGKEKHGLTMDANLERRVIGLIHDEDSDSHRESMGAMLP